MAVNSACKVLVKWRLLTHSFQLSVYTVRILHQCRIKLQCSSDPASFPECKSSESRLASVWQASAEPIERDWLSRRLRERDRKVFLWWKNPTSASTPCALWNANIVRGRDTVASVITWPVTHTYSPLWVCVRVMMSKGCSLTRRDPMWFQWKHFRISPSFTSEYVVSSIHASCMFFFVCSTCWPANHLLEAFSVMKVSVKIHFYK